MRSVFKKSVKELASPKRRYISPKKKTNKLLIN